MPRGIRNGSDIDGAVQQFCGRIEERIILFAAEVGVSANWVAERLSTLLSPQREGIQHYVSELRQEAPRIRGTLESVAVVVDAHRGVPPPAIEASRKTSGIKEYWAAMTPEQKSAVMRDKLLKTAKLRELTPTEKSRLKTLKAKSANTLAPDSKKRTQSKTKEAVSTRKAPSRKTLSEAERRAKQQVYVARSLARKEGRPVPPLPSEAKQGGKETAGAAA